MSAPAINAGKLRFRAIDGGRARDYRDKAGSERADALFFRGQTLAIIRHFFEIASQIGRLPSILGREFFRARVSHHTIPSFEEQAVFVHDVERTLGRLNDDDAEVIALVGLFQYSLDEAAALLGRSRTNVAVRFADSVDRLAELFLAAGLLQENRPDRRLQRFATPGPATELPPKKPVASLGAESYHVVGGEDPTHSYVAQRSSQRS
jgi:DNA-directed RNA polymerase specialized sigma24 family protein